MAAGYYVCAVHYQTVGNERQITKVKTTFYLSTEIGASAEKAKAAVITDIESGRQVRIKVKPGKKWHEGKDVRVAAGESGAKYLCIDGIDGMKDYLGNLPEY